MLIMTGYHDPKQIYSDFLRSASVCPESLQYFPQISPKENSGPIAGVDEPGVCPSARLV